MLSRLTLNSLWLLLARLGTQLGMAFFTIMLARWFGSSTFGEFTFIASVIVIGNVLTTFGTDMVLIREIAASNKLSYLFPALIIQVFLSILFIVVIFTTSSHLPNLDLKAVAALRIYSFSLIPLAFFTVFTTFLRGQQRMLAYSFLNLALMILQLAAIFWLRLFGGGLIILAILLFLVQAFGTLLAGYFCQFQIQNSSESWLLLKGQLWELIKVCAPIALLGLLGIFYQRLSLIIILSLSSSSLTGYYSAAARVVEAAKIGHVAVFTALYPLMSQVNANIKSNAFNTFRLLILFLLSGALLGSFILSHFAGPVITILFGADYVTSIAPLQILAWILIPYTINSFFSLAFLARGDVIIIMIALVVSTITLATLTNWWLPLINLKGAAWAALCSETLQSIILLGGYFLLPQKIIYRSSILDRDFA